MSEPELLFEREGPLATVTFNRPEARNAINGAVAQALDQIVRDLEQDPDAWVIEKRTPRRVGR